MNHLLQQIRSCTACDSELPLGAKPVLLVNSKSKIAVIGQAPGTKVHASGIPWDDQSGKLLRHWLGVTDEQFYNPDNFAIVPMGFCYPGRGKSGDLPPRKECAPLWHDKVFSYTNQIELILLIGMYSQKYYLGNDMKRTLTETVKSYQEYMPKYFPMPHPSPRNRIWLKKNPWFEKENIPHLRQLVSGVID